MPRLVIKTASAPQQVGDKWICMCGMSKNQPFCDSSHKKLKEDKDSVYVYEDGEQRVVSEIVVDGQGCCGGDCCHDDSKTDEHGHEHGCCGHCKDGEKEHKHK